MIISQSKNNFPLLIISYPSVQLTKSKHQISTLKSQVTKTQMTKDHLGTIINNKSINYFASIIYANTLVPSHNNPKKNVIISSSAFMHASIMYRSNSFIQNYNVFAPAGRLSFNPIRHSAATYLTMQALIIQLSFLFSIPDSHFHWLCHP